MWLWSSCACNAICLAEYWHLFSFFFDNLLMNFDDIDLFCVVLWLLLLVVVAFNSIWFRWQKWTSRKKSMYSMLLNDCVVFVCVGACALIYVFVCRRYSYVRRPRVDVNWYNTHLSTNVKNFNTKILKSYLKWIVCSLSHSFNTIGSDALEIMNVPIQSQAFSLFYRLVVNLTDKCIFLPQHIWSLFRKREREIENLFCLNVVIFCRITIYYIEKIQAIAFQRFRKLSIVFQ